MNALVMPVEFNLCSVQFPTIFARLWRILVNLGEIQAEFCHQNLVHGVLGLATFPRQVVHSLHVSLKVKLFVENNVITAVAVAGVYFTLFLLPVLVNFGSPFREMYPRRVLPEAANLLESHVTRVALVPP